MKKQKGFDLADYESCANCTYAKAIDGESLYICRKKGPVEGTDHCRRFQLDLLAVRPKKLRTLNSALTEDDFSL